MFKRILTKCWEAFLHFHGYTYSRTESSHDMWVKKGFRTIPVWGNEKEIPAMHIKTSCRTIGCTTADAYSWAQKNC